jgi:hypothetical protein
MNIDLNDKFEVKNIRFSKCADTGERLVSMLIPIEHADDTSWERVTMEVEDLGLLLADGFLPHLDILQCAIAGAENEQDVEYIDGNPLNLRRDNLRLVELSGPLAFHEG